MNVIIGIDPHKASHTAVAIDGVENELGRVRVRATRQQVDHLMAWADLFERRTWAVESAGGLGYLLAQQLVGSGRRGPRRAGHPGLEGAGAGTGRSDKNDPNDALSVAIAALRSTKPRSSRPPTIGRCCVSWPNGITRSGGTATWWSAVSMPLWPTSHRVDFQGTERF